MKKILIILAVLLIAITGCTEYVEETMEQDIEEKTGEDAEVEIEGNSVKITGSDDGTDYEIEASGDGDEWCDDDAAFNIQATGANSGQYIWEVVGIVNSGEYNGLCHMKAYLETPDGTIESDYYVDEEGETVHMQLSSSGMGDYDIDYSS